MGKKGRAGAPPKPLEFKARDGTRRKDRETPDVPPAVPATPEMPAYLDGRAAELWDWHVAELGPEGRNILTSADAQSLAVYCKSLAEFEQKPSVGREASLRTWAAVFGTTPADRQRIPAVTPPKPKGEVLKPRGAK